MTLAIDDNGLGTAGKARARRDALMALSRDRRAVSEADVARGWCDVVTWGGEVWGGEVWGWRREGSGKDEWWILEVRP